MHARFVPILVLLFAGAAAMPVHAQRVAPTPPAWDQLDAAQQAALVAPIRARWDANPDERARMLEHARRWQSMSSEERIRARKGLHRWEGMSPELQQQARALHARLRTLPEAERGALRERWKAMTPEQRAAWAQANPPPARASRSRDGQR